MTMNCARCRSQDRSDSAERLLLVGCLFRDIRRYSDDRNVRSAANLTDITPPEKRAGYEGELDERKAKIAAIIKRMTAIEDEAIKKMPAEDQRAAEGTARSGVVKKVPQFLSGGEKTEYEKLRRERVALEKKPDPSQDLALSVNNCTVRPPQTNVLVRGNVHAPGAAVEPAFPEVLGASAPKIPPLGKDARTSGRRTVLANWIASKENPLTARVIVNRIWQATSVEDHCQLERPASLACSPHLWVTRLAGDRVYRAAGR